MTGLALIIGFVFGMAGGRLICWIDKRNGTTPCDVIERLAEMAGTDLDSGAIIPPADYGGIDRTQQPYWRTVHREAPPDA